MLTSVGLPHRLVLAPVGVPFGSLGAVLAFSEHEAVQQGTTDHRRRGGVEVVILPSAEQVARVVADAVGRVLTDRQAPVIGLATGASPLATYRLLIEDHRAGRVGIGGASAVLLDEYVGLPPNHPETYRAFIRRHFTDHIDLLPDRLFGPDVWAEDIAAACERYERLISDLGGVDLQLLGIGSDGHIGFNEPSSSLGSRTRIKTLTSQTRADNAPSFGVRGGGPSPRRDPGPGDDW